MKQKIDEMVPFDGISPDVQNTLLDRARHLLEAVTHEGLDKIYRPESIGFNPSQTQLAEAFASISEDRVIEKNPVPALLACPIVGRDREEVLEIVQAWVFACSILLEGQESAIKSACRRVRRMYLGYDEWLLDALVEKIDVNEEDFEPSLVVIEDALESIQRGIRGASKLYDAKRRRVADLRVPIARLRYGGDPPGPKKRGGTDNDNIRLIRQDLGGLSGSDARPNEMIADVIPAKRGSLEPPTSVGNQGFVSPKVIPFDEYRDHRSQQTRRGRQVASSIQMSRVYAPCDWNLMSPIELDCFLFAVYNGTLDSDQNCMWTMLGVVFGRRPTDLCCLPIRRHRTTSTGGECWYITDRRIYLEHNLVLPQLVLEPHELTETTPPVNSLRLPVPPKFEPILREELLKVSVRKRRRRGYLEGIVDQLKDIGRAIGFQITDRRVAEIIDRTMRRMGVDPVCIKRIKGFEADRNIPQYYDSSAKSLTLGAFRDYVNDVLKRIGHEKEFTYAATKEERYGSSLAIKDSSIEHRMSIVRNHLEKSRVRCLDVVSFHNTYVLYTYMILVMCSGHRDVKNPFETIRDFNFYSNTLYISDKAARSFVDSRTVVLPEIAIEQVKAYLSHLKILERTLARSHPTANRAARGARKGTGSLLFRIEESGFDDCEVVEFTPTSLAIWLKNEWYWAFPLNWNRHWLRTRLTEKKVAHETLQAFLGHDPIGIQELNNFARLSYADEKELAKSIEELVRGVGVLPAEGLQ